MSARVTVGDLRTRLTLESPSRTSDGAGGSDIAWETVGDVWARVTPLNGEEDFALDRVAGKLRHEIVIRYRAGVTLEMRFRDGERVYDIRAAFDPDARRHWLKCIADIRDL